MTWQPTLKDVIDGPPPETCEAAYYRDERGNWLLSFSWGHWSQRITHHIPLPDPATLPTPMQWPEKPVFRRALWHGEPVWLRPTDAANYRFAVHGERRQLIGYTDTKDPDLQLVEDSNEP